MKIFGLIFWLCVFFIGYVYVGYPLILAVLARLRRKPTKYPEITPQVSILIASKLENTLSLDYPMNCMQIVVAVDGSDDHTAEIVETYAVRGVELSYDA